MNYVATRVSFKCNDCPQLFRVDNPAPTVQSALKYCPICGRSNTAVYKDNDLDCDEVLAESFGMPIQLYKTFYDCWLLDPDRPRSLREFMARINKPNKPT